MEKDLDGLPVCLTVHRHSHPRQRGRHRRRVRRGDDARSGTANARSGFKQSIGRRKVMAMKTGASNGRDGRPNEQGPKHESYVHDIPPCMFAGFSCWPAGNPNVSVLVDLRWSDAGSEIAVGPVGVTHYTSAAKPADPRDDKRRDLGRLAWSPRGTLSLW